MSTAPDLPLCVLENVTRPLPSFDPQVRHTEGGRLILVPDALHFVQGWETHEVVERGHSGLFGMLLELATRPPELVDTRAEGARMLAQVQSLPPAEQVRAVAGSVTVPASDIESARLGFFDNTLRIVTEARGEAYDFQIARKHRRQVQAWLSGLPRR